MGQQGGQNGSERIDGDRKNGKQSASLKDSL